MTPQVARKLDSVHENETGFGDLLASGLANEHHENETGFSFIQEG